MQRPESDEISAEWLGYVEYLESCVNGAGELIIEMNLTSKEFASDLRLIRNGEGGQATYIGKSDKTKRFEHAMMLFDKIDKVKALAVITKEEPKSEKPKKNIQDFKLRAAQ